MTKLSIMSIREQNDAGYVSTPIQARGNPTIPLIICLLVPILLVSLGIIFL